jgi:hypothetical protein
VIIMRSLVLGSSVALAFAQAASAQIQVPVRKVDGVLILSSDDKFIADIRTTWRMGQSYGAAAKLFPSDRFVVHEWGKRSMIVIDLRTGPLGYLAARVSAQKALTAKIGQDGTVQLKDLSVDDRHGLRLDGGPEGGWGAWDGSLALYVSVAFTIHKGEETRKVDVPLSGNNARWDALRKHPLVRSEKNAIANRSALPTANPLEAYDVGVHLLGIAPQHFGEGFREASKVTEVLETNLYADLTAASLELIKKVGLVGDGLKGPSPFKDLPKGMRDELSSSFSASWKSLGFANKLDAESFLLNSGSLEMTTSLGISFLNDPGDPSVGRPSSGGCIIFGTLKGGVGPP